MLDMIQVIKMSQMEQRISSPTINAQSRIGTKNITRTINAQSRTRDWNLKT